MTQLPTPEELGQELEKSRNPVGQWETWKVMRDAIRADREAIAKCVLELEKAKLKTSRDADQFGREQIYGYVEACEDIASLLRPRRIQSDTTPDAAQG